MKEEAKFIFDVDGTLTPSRQKMDPEFKKWFKDFCINNDVYLVTGSDYKKTQEQMGDDILRWPIMVYGCSGNDVWCKGERLRSKHWDVPDELYDFMHSWLQASRFPLRTGLHIEKRPGCINYSIVGRNATLGERQLYMDWDCSNHERKTIAYQINSIFDNITAMIGGETGIDIYPTGWDKSQILDDFDLKADKIYFFGDKCDEGGNDYPISKLIKKHYHVKNWRNTWEILKYLQEANIAN